MGLISFLYILIGSDEGFDNKMENDNKSKRVRRSLLEENIRLRKEVRHSIRSRAIIQNTSVKNTYRKATKLYLFPPFRNLNYYLPCSWSIRWQCMNSDLTNQTLK